MKQITLRNLYIRNFKGIGQLEVEPTRDTRVEGENGKGKTTILDAFLWLLFDKDSTGRTEFGIRPLDSKNQPIKGLVCMVEAVLNINGRRCVLKKEHHEKVVKDQLRGYTTLCWVDDVPKKAGQYAEYIGGIIPEDSFRLLTNLRHFNENLSWKDRRAVLLDIADEIGTPAGFDELLSALNGRSLDDYKKVLAGQLERHRNEREEINPRIDELQRGLQGAGALANETDLQARRQVIQEEIAQIDTERRELLDQEQQRQAKIDQVNALKSDRIKREAELARDTRGIKHLLDEKAQLAGELVDRRALITDIDSRLQVTRRGLLTAGNHQSRLMHDLEQVRAEYGNALAVNANDTCYACGQTLPQDRLNEAEAKKQDALAEINRHGKELFDQVEISRGVIEDLKNDVKELENQLQTATAELAQAEAAQEARLAEIDAAIKAYEILPPQQDQQWQAITVRIDGLIAEIGEPVSERLEALNAARSQKTADLGTLDRTLAQADRIKRDRARIAELEAREKELAQAIADVERQMADIDRYSATESQMIEDAVNGQFKQVQFKLFKERLNGGLEPCCEAMLHGVPYGGMSGGERIVVGIDIINVLTRHYGLNAPLFIDNAESVTLPIETECQTVKLYAVEGMPLTVDRKEVQHAV